MIVVTGASGRLGRAVAAALAAHGKTTEVRLTARAPGKIADLGAQGFATARADYADRPSMERAFDGADMLLLISGVTPNDVRIKEHRDAIDAAKAAGVGRIVYTSFTNATAMSLFPFAAIHADTEAYLRASGLPHTILRNNAYAANLDGPLVQSRDTGMLTSTEPSAKVAYVTHADAAAAAAGVLVGKGHDNKTYEITGPEAVDFHQIAAALSAARGKLVSVVRIEPADIRAYLESIKLPAFLVEALLGSNAAAAAGEYNVVSGDAARLAGRPTESMLDYVRRFA